MINYIVNNKKRQTQLITLCISTNREHEQLIPLLILLHNKRVLIIENLLCHQNTLPIPNTQYLWL